MTTCKREVVAALEQAIAQRIGEPRYQLWFPNKTKFAWHDGQLRVGVPNHFYQEWLKKQFADVIRAVASEVAAEPIDVQFVIDPELFQEARREEAAAKPVALVAQLAKTVQQDIPGPPPPDDDRPRPDPKPRQRSTRRWRHLHDFVVGPCNRVAHASALSAVEAPAQGPNPLVLHGPVGTGKSHLLEGIYAGLRKGHPEWRVVFATAEEFTNRFLPALRIGKLASFRNHFRECDALLLDDLHFLATKRATQEEFLHTFNALQTEGKPVVVTCDCHPRLADLFVPELTDRLLGGAIWGLMQPDTQTRLELLKAKVGRQHGQLIPEPVLRFLAEKLHGNVRELEGALHSVQHYSRVAGRPVDLGLARDALGDLLRHSVRVFRLEDVDRAVCSALRLETGALQSKQRNWSQAHPRMLAIYLARKHTSATYTEVGAYFGGRNHSTAVAAEKKVKQWVTENGPLQLGERAIPVREVLELAERELSR
ncbi:MAG TPA: DnaA/Hda family protein [Gemmataceae bacterium]|nr:DnaA/Hda family protein [Gemmataceae bacterium]